eukprot:7379385-Prymnesium_polylepis.3
MCCENAAQQQASLQCLYDGDGRGLPSQRERVKMKEWVNSEARIVKNDHGFTLGDLLAEPLGVDASRRPRL